MGVDDVDDDTSVTSLQQWDSLAHITLILALEEEFGLSFTPDEAAEMLSVPDIERILASRPV